jgi:seryl-tRNA synthetase
VIDLRLLRDDPDLFRKSQRARGEDESLVDEVLAADERRRAAVTDFDRLRAEQKSLGRAVSTAADTERAALLDQARSLAADVERAGGELTTAEEALRLLVRRLPNLVAEDAPIGGEDDSVVVETVGSVPTFDFEPRDHVELGELLGVVDVQRAAKVSGARFYFLVGAGAQLELALLSLAMRQALDCGLTPVIPPVLVRPEAMEGTGFLGAHAAEVYHLPEEDLYLVGTSEVPLAAFHGDEILAADVLPRRYAAFSTCFRREAGSYGKDTRGIIRVHQFDKVEMFSFCRPADADAEHRQLLAWEKRFLDLLELPYRVVDIAAGDLGMSAARKFDCEAWIPTQGRYREVTSASNCTDFQARRLGVRFRDDDGVRPVATLNGTLVAMARTIVALLEVHQRADGSVRLPAALHEPMGCEVLEPAR